MGRYRPGRLRFEMFSRWRIEAVWQARSMGASNKTAAEAAGVTEGTAARYFASMGGIAPQKWKDPDRFLTIEERFRIKELVSEKIGVREIARRIGRHPSTVSRELKRGGAVNGRHAKQYSPVAAQRAAFHARRRPKPLKIPSNPHLLALIQQGLENKLSPEQICGRLRLDYPDRDDLRVSHETIYKTIYLQARGGLKRDIQALTRTGRTLRFPQHRSGQRRGQIKDMVSIWERPVEALDRRVPGHWEGDLIVGKDGKSAIATIVERHSNYLILGWLDPTLPRPQATARALANKLPQLPATLRRSLTWDQGKEMHEHAQISIDAGIDIYFADPHAPWQRATNENTNGLLRQYFPKGTDLSIYSQEDLDYVANEMNNRPRKRLDFATPYEVLSTHLLQ